MKLHVPDLETCKMLKDAGFPQETCFCWCWDDFGSYLDNQLKLPFENSAAAPIATEILDKLPNDVLLWKDDNALEYFCEYKDLIEQEENRDVVETLRTSNTNPATACALMWLRKENKL